MAATASAMLDLTNKATNLAREVSSGWYKASQAMDLFPARLIELRKRSDEYTTLFNRYGMENDIEPLLRVVIQLLEDEEVKLRRLQDNCCLRTGKKLLFPDSVITALDGVLEAFDRLPEHINARESLAEQLERSGNSKPRLLPFSHDDKYVLLKKSVVEVRTALESESSARIVVISGGPGQGKSSMARYLACLYQNGMRIIRQAQRIPEPASSSLNQAFENGVIFLKCGAQVNTKSLLVQLWQDMGFQELPLSTTSQELAGDQNDLQEENILKKLSARLQNQKVLIVLDDVWDPTVVEKLMVQGKSVKYLVTTQVPRFRCDAMDIHISKPNKQEANCIIANYVTGYPKEISSDIQMEIDSIIEESDFNPLLLANVATSLRHGEASVLSEWKSTRKYLADLQDGDVKRPVSLYDRSYSKRTMGASMEMALNSFSSEEQTLVLLASVFESRPIPEVVFKILFKSVHSSLARFSKSSELLVRSNFIEIQSVSGNAIWGSISRRGWSIHTMRQNFINRIKEKEIDVMFTKLCQQVEHNDIVAMLLVMYGQVPWCDTAARKLEIPRKQFEDNDITGENFPLTRMIEPFVWLLNGEPQNETEKQSHELATQIIHKYLHSNELDSISISTLLQEPKMFSTTSEALYATQILHDTSPTFQIGDTSSSPLKALVGNLAHTNNPQLQKEAVVTLAIICKNMPANAIKVGSFPHAMERLVALLDCGVPSQTQAHAAKALGGLSINVVENAVRIGSFPHVVERLVALLVSSQTQPNAARALGELSNNVVENPMRIGSFPHVVERLVALLDHGVPSQTQEWAAWALGGLSINVVENAVRIGSFPHAVERLVALLDHGVPSQTQANAAGALGQISISVVENAMRIGSFPHAVERLVALLDNGVPSQTQEWAAWALGRLSVHVVENAVRIGSSPHAVERLVALLDHGVPSQTQEWAAWTLGRLSVKVVENAVRIGSFPHVVERLVAILDHGVPLQTQKQVAWALARLSVNVVGNAMRIGSFPHAVERLVALLDHEVPFHTQQRVAWALVRLSVNAVENAIRIGSFPHAVERLVALLDHGVPSQTQEWAACALGRLSVNLVENGARIGSFPHVMERLVALLDHGVPSQTQQRGAWALARLSLNVVENAVRIGSFPYAVERLVALLDHGVPSQTQADAARALGQLSVNVVENAMRIGSFPHVVERLVALLDHEVPSQTQECAAWALGGLSINVVENAMRIGSFPHVVGKLVALLVMGREDYEFRWSIIRCLWSISYGVDEIQLVLKRVFLENPSSIEILASCASMKAQGVGLANTLEHKFII